MAPAQCALLVLLSLHCFSDATEAASVCSLTQLSIIPA